MNLMKHLLCILLAFFSMRSHATNYALLIGISDYEPAHIRDLEGPVNDVQDMFTVIQSWGFNAKNIQTLLDSQATRDNIINAIQHYSQQLKTGDQLFIFFSGHGTSGKDPNNPVLAAGEGAFLPYDMPKLGGSLQQQQQALKRKLIVVKRDLKPFFEQLDKNQVLTTLMMDACYSQRIVTRSIKNQKITLPTRSVDLDWGLTLSQAPMPTLTPQLFEQGPFYKNVFYMASSKHDQTSVDIPKAAVSMHQSFNDKPHGAFSSSLLRLLTQPQLADADGDGKLTYLELFRSTKKDMAMHSFPQTPTQMPSEPSETANWSDRAIFDSSRTVAPNADTNQPLQLLVKQQNQMLNQQLQRLPLQLVELNQTADITLMPSGNQYKLYDGGDEISTLNESALEPYLKGRIRLKQLQQLTTGDVNVSALTQDPNSQLKLGQRYRFNIQSKPAGQLILFAVDSQNQLVILHGRGESAIRLQGNYVSYTSTELKAEEPPGIDYLFAVVVNNDRLLQSWWHDMGDQDGMPSFNLANDQLFNRWYSQLQQQRLALGVERIVTVSKAMEKNGYGR